MQPGLLLQFNSAPGIPVPPSFACESLEIDVMEFEPFPRRTPATLSRHAFSEQHRAQPDTGLGSPNTPYDLSSHGVALSTSSARVLLIAAESEEARVAEQLLGQLDNCWVAHDRASALAIAETHQPEVAIVELTFPICDGPAIALQVATAARYLQPIFFAGPSDEGELAAARDMGFRYVRSLDNLRENLAEFLLPLAELVRLRRRIDHLEATVLVAEQAQVRQFKRLTLPEAERRYRETYVRSLLAESGSRREAARRAGVPYTTLCEIVRKLCIE